MAVRDYQPQQYLMLFSQPRDVLGEDHLCFVVDDIVESFDLSKLPAKKGTPGAPCYDYRLLIKILFYGYATGTFSSRKLMRSTMENIPYLYLARQQTPNFRTISDFRKNHKSFLENAFISIVKTAKELGIVKLGCVALDGTKIRANANRTNQHTHAELEEERERIEKAIEEAIKEDEEEDRIFGRDKTGDELPDEIKTQAKRLKKIKGLLSKAKGSSKDTINSTDPDASLMKDKGAFKLSYNYQIAVDTESGLIIDQQTTTSPSDQKAVKEHIVSIKENMGEKPKKLLADSGYYSVDNLTYLENEDIDSYMPHPDDARDKKDKYKTKPQPFDKRYFKYEKPDDCYICKEDKVLRKFANQPKRDLTIYRAKDCPECKNRTLCLRSKKGLRTVSRYTNEEFIEMMRHKLTTEDGKRHYRKRAPAAESPFGHFKKNLGFRQFFLRGHKAVSCESRLLCIGYNIKKIAQIMLAKKRKSAFEPVFC